MSTQSRWRGNKEWQAEGQQRSNLVTLAGRILKTYPVFYSEGVPPSIDFKFIVYVLSLLLETESKYFSGVFAVLELCPYMVKIYDFEFI